MLTFSPLIPNGPLDVFTSHDLHHAVTRDNIFYSKGHTYPKVSGAPANDFKHDLTGGYLGGGFIRSMFLVSEHLEWFLAATVNQIEWGNINHTINGKTFRAVRRWHRTRRRESSVRNLWLDFQLVQIGTNR